ncbi:MAG TPA: hypothetical protein V6C65_17050 [Allocoleopsis sp.]
MLKQIGSFGVLASLLMASAAHAGTIQSNEQNAVQDAAAVGAYSTVDQTMDQSNYQDMYGNGGYYYGTPEIQDSIQNGVQQGAAVGPYSNVYQDLDQDNYQTDSTYSFPYFLY